MRDESIGICFKVSGRSGIRTQLISFIPKDESTKIDIDVMQREINQKFFYCRFNLHDFKHLKLIY